jgi:predicted permease
LIQLLINSFLPVSLLILLGYVSAKKTIFQYEDALSIIKYIGVIAVPALTLNMTVSISFANVNWLLISSYIISELVIYLTAIFIAKYFFNLKWNDTILIGMASSFANHLLFVYPIALNEYGPELIDPIIAIIGFDVAFLVVNLIILDFIKYKNLELSHIVFKQLSNLPLLAVLTGLFIVFLDFNLPLSIERALNFISGSAAPCALFAAGIILSQKIEKTDLKISNLIIGFKILLHPLIAILIMWNLNEIEFSISETAIMVAAAPVGLMALVFSTQYDVNPNAITRALLISTLLSIISIPLVSTLS